MSRSKVDRARDRWKGFSARNSKCPICKSDFRAGCNHSVVQAQDRLFENYIQAVVEAKKPKAPIERVVVVKTFSEWEDAGYRVLKGSKAVWVEGLPMFTPEQVTPRIIYKAAKDAC